MRWHFHSSTRKFVDINVHRGWIIDVYVQHGASF
jgi:hypothetical protein